MKTDIEYTYKGGEWIALEHASGDSIQVIHRHHPDLCPAPMLVKRWRKRYPQFDALMVEAEETRADLLAEETITISDDPNLQAAAARNAIGTRQWLAERLNRGRFGNSRSVDVSVHGTIDHRHMAQLSDSQLLAIAQGAVIEGEASQVVSASDQAPGAPESCVNKESAPPHPPARRAVPSPHISSLVIPDLPDPANNILGSPDISDSSSVKGLRNVFDE